MIRYKGCNLLKSILIWLVLVWTKKPCSAADEHAEVLQSYTKIERLSASDSKIYFEQTTLVYNQEGMPNCFVVTDESTRINKLSLQVFKLDGTLLLELDKSDFQIAALNSNYVLISGLKVLYPTISSHALPIKIKFQYEILQKNTIGFGTWQPAYNYRIKVHNATLEVHTKANTAINFLATSDVIEHTTWQKNKLQIDSWSLKNYTSLSEEKYARDIDFVAPSVIVAPLNFDYYGSKGSFSSWEDHSKWTYNLYQKDNELSEDYKKAIHQSLSNCTTKLDSIAAVYKLMQSKTRYVAIEDGLNGYCPISPAKTELLGYGDCKSLSNLTRVMLKEVGIDSYCAIIGASHVNIDYPQLPCVNQMNHAILCVPMEQDTIWLECTAKNIPPNFLFPSTENRLTLLIKEENGHLVRTKKTTFSEFDNSLSITANIDGSGSIYGSFNQTFTGNKLPQGLRLLSTSVKRQNEYLSSSFSIENITLNNITVTHSQHSDSVILTMNFAHEPFFRDNDKMMSLNCNPFSAFEFDAAKEERESDIFIEQPITNSLEYEVNVLDNYVLASKPDSVFILSPFGFLKFYVSYSENTIRIIRTYAIFDGQYAASQYVEFSAFLEQIAKCDKTKLLLKKKD
jgi:hypothetical protein